MAAAKSVAKMPVAKPKKPRPKSANAVYPSFVVGNVQTQTGDEITTRMAIFIWGPSTCGKTTLAATSPGHKLWLSFGDNEHVSVMHRNDVTIANLSSMSLDDLFKHAQSDDPFGLDKILREQEHIDTVVVDSVTALTFRALQKSVKGGVGAGKHFRPSMETPGQAAYGGRNAVVLEVLTGLLKVTAAYNVHIVLTAHEDDPKTRQENNTEVIDYITVMLGGKIVNNMTWRLSEIWYMSQESTGKLRRRIAVRPIRYRKPMKTRMFSGKDFPEFYLDYDADKPDDGQMTIASFYKAWERNGYRKIAVPDNMRKAEK